LPRSWGIVSRSVPVSRFQTWRTTSTMPSRKSVAGGVEPLDFAAADEAVGQLVEVVLLATRGRMW
jgi:hypothetical protein